MASRAEEKKRLREEREAREREEREAAARRKRLIQIGTGAAVVVVAAIIAVVALSSGGSSKSKGQTPTGVNPQGLQESPGPWPPEYSKLPQRLAAMQLPQTSDVIFHIHANMEVYTDGKRQTVPSQVGIDQTHQLLASLHTHDTSGVIHMEAVQPYPFKLGQFFNVWGVKLTQTQLGDYHVGNGLVLQVWVNGKQVKSFVNYVMKPHDRIVVGFGKPGSFPTKNNFKFPAGE
ncbi:MAG: hypothetical protein E6G07_01305 [Actinobacteria bacterium]|nr:MAG: hypothetical protein E6G53_07485 [Actinomycetota bacterium]TML83517.1 MAG: hypothetical protein E6G07_01305 [Actinomycetota bacterium]